MPEKGILYSIFSYTNYLIEKRDIEKFKNIYWEVSFFDERKEVITKIETIYNQKYSEFIAE